MENGAKHSLMTWWSWLTEGEKFVIFKLSRKTDFVIEFYYTYIKNLILCKNVYLNIDKICLPSYFGGLIRNI